MSLELTMLIAFIGLVTIRAMIGDSGPIGAFRNSSSSLGARMEVEMTTGRCFSLPRGGGSACSAVQRWE